MDKHFNVDYLFENQFEYIIYLKEERKLVRQFKFILPNIEPNKSYYAHHLQLLNPIELTQNPFRLTYLAPRLSSMFDYMSSIRHKPICQVKIVISLLNLILDFQQNQIDLFYIMPQQIYIDVDSLTLYVLTDTCFVNKSFLKLCPNYYSQFFQVDVDDFRYQLHVSLLRTIIELLSCNDQFNISGRSIREDMECYFDETIQLSSKYNLFLSKFKSGLGHLLTKDKAAVAQVIEILEDHFSFKDNKSAEDIVKNLHFSWKKEEQLLSNRFDSNFNDIPSCVFIQGDFFVGKTYFITYFFEQYKLKNALTIQLHYHHFYSPMQDLLAVADAIYLYLFKIPNDQFEHFKDMLTLMISNSYDFSILQFFPKLQLLLDDDVFLEKKAEKNFNRFPVVKLVYFILDMIKIISKVVPLLVFFNKVHGGKQNSLYFLDAFLANMNDFQGMMIFSYDFKTPLIDRIQSGFSKQVTIDHIYLKAFDVDAVLHTVQKAFGVVFEDMDVFDLFYKYTQGLPFKMKRFLQELIRLNVLSLNGGNWILKKSKYMTLNVSSLFAQETFQLDNIRVGNDIKSFLGCFNFPFSFSVLKYCVPSLTEKDYLTVIQYYKSNNQLFDYGNNSYLMEQHAQTLLYNSLSDKDKKQAHNIIIRYINDIFDEDYVIKSFIAGFHIQKIFKELVINVDVSRRIFHQFYKGTVMAFEWGFYAMALKHFTLLTRFRQYFELNRGKVTFYDILLYRAICYSKLNDTFKAKRLFMFLYSKSLPEEFKIRLIKEMFVFFNLHNKHQESLKVSLSLLEDLHKGVWLRYPFLVNLSVLIVLLKVKVIEWFLFKPRLNNKSIFQTKDYFRYIVYENIAYVGGSIDSLYLTYASLKMSQLSLLYKPCSQTQMGFLLLGYLYLRLGNFKKAFYYIDFHHDVNLLPESDVKGSIFFAHTIMFLHFRKPFQEYIMLYNKSFDYCMDDGNLIFANASKVLKCFAQISMGASLNIIYEELNSFSLSIYNQYFKEDIDVFLTCINLLLGNFDVNFENLDINAFSNKKYHSFTSQVTMTIIYYFFNEDYKQVLHYGDLAKKYITSYIQGLIYIEFIFIYSMSILIYYFKTGQRVPLKKWRYVMNVIQRFSKMSDLCRENFNTKYYLLLAFKYRTQKQYSISNCYFVKVVEHAMTYDMLSVLAIAHEGLLENYIKDNCLNLAYYHYQEAIKYYDQWGCIIKVEKLKTKYDNLFAKTSYSISDFNSIWPNIQNIIHHLSYETNTSSFFLKLLQFMKEFSHAEKGFVMLKVGSIWKVVVRYDSENDGIFIDDMLMEDVFDISMHVVKHVNATGKSVNVVNPSEDSLFSFDPYVHLNKPTNICCMPIFKHNSSKGIIYLQNTTSGKYISHELFDNLQFFVSQFMFAFENASLIRENKELIKNLEIRVQQQVSQIRDAEEAKLQSQLLVQKTAEQSAYATLTRGIAHEIRNPMAMILSGAELILDNISDGVMVKKYASVMKNSILRLKHISNSMLRYGHPVSENRSKVDIKELIEDTMLVCSSECKKRRIVMSANYDHTFDIVGEVNSMSQALLNVVLNGIQAIDINGTILIKTGNCTFKNKVNQVTEGVFISIEDDGIGIPKDKLDKIFDPFYSTKYGNAGLGLSIVFKTIDLHNGFIDIDSEEGKFTRVLLYFSKTPVMAATSVVVT